MPSVFETIPFRQIRRAQTELAAIGEGLPAQVPSQVETLLVSAADPDAALHYLLNLKQRKPAEFEKLALSPHWLQYLVTVFSYSRFLSEELLQNPLWIEQLDDLQGYMSAGEFRKRLTSLLKKRPGRMPEALTLSLFRRQQILRILLRDVLGFWRSVRDHGGAVESRRRHSRRQLQAHSRGIWSRGTACRATSTKTAKCANAGCR